MFPEDSIQNALGTDDWWVEDKGARLCRGSLVFAFVPHVDQTPFTFEPIGRKDPEKHDAAELMVKPLSANAPLTQTALPVAAMTAYHNEVWAAYRAKKRPCLVLGTESPAVDRKLTNGKPKNQTAPTVLVAPYYGVDQNGKRSGYKETFVEAVKHCEYPQFFLDILPVKGVKESLLRLDHLQPVGTHHNSYSTTGFRLSETALEVIDDMFQWLIYGGVEEESLLRLYRAEIEDALG